MNEENWIVGVDDDSDYFLVGPEMYPGIVAVPVVRVHNEKIAHLFSAAPELIEALRDMLDGWKYIRSMHGDLYGVGWDRAQQKAEAAIAKATGV